MPSSWTGPSGSRRAPLSSPVLRVPLGRWGDARSPDDDDLVQIMLVAGPRVDEPNEVPDCSTRQARLRASTF
jgi:hypothetical protein